MYDHDQSAVPESFVALYLVSGRLKPTATRAAITARYEFCEDLANHLVEVARARRFDLGISEGDVLERCRRGLLAEPATVSEAEAEWVVRRLAELEGWA